MNSPTANTAQIEKLAIHGGAPVLAHKLDRPLRWGKPELNQLTAMLRQSSLFYWNGAQTKLLTQRFQEHYPFKYVMPCSSGTASIHIAVAVAGIGPGDEVITSPITDMGTVIGILYQQGVPVFADLELHRYNLEVADVASKITPRTKAIIAVHLCGNPCDMAGLKKLAAQHNLVLIEDCAQAWGAKYRRQPIGTIGDIGCYSLNDFKHIGCGDGGIVATNHEKFGPLLQKFGDKAYDRIGGTRAPEVLALNYRISEPQSAVAAAQMTRLREIADRRSMLGLRLTKGITGVRGVRPHHVDAEDMCSFWFYMFRLEPDALTCDRETFVKALAAEGVPCSAGYISMPLYQYPVFQNHNFFAGRWPIRELGLTQMDYRTVRCPETEAILETCVRVEIHQAMDEAWMDGVARAIRKVAAHFSK